MSPPDQPPDEACFFLDVDGTLIDLAATPDAVRVPDDLPDTLDRLARRFRGAVAFVSGRSIANLDRLFAPLQLPAAGVHGAELRLPGGDAAGMTVAEPLPRATWDALAAMLAAFPGTLVEDKAFSYAVHYRAVPEAGPALAEGLERFLGGPHGSELQLLPGHFVYELKRPNIDKGAAIRTFMDHAPFAGRVPIFIGDDVTDMPGFAAVAALGGRAYSVKAPFPAVAGTFPTPTDVRAWLGRIARVEGGLR